MLHVFRNSKPLKEGEASEMITQMLNTLLYTRAYSGNTTSHFKVVEKSRAYINEHFSEPLTLEQLAKNANMSPFHFSRLLLRPASLLINTLLPQESILPNSC